MTFKHCGHVDQPKSLAVLTLHVGRPSELGDGLFRGREYCGSPSALGCAVRFGEGAVSGSLPSLRGFVRDLRLRRYRSRSLPGIAIMSSIGKKPSLCSTRRSSSRASVIFQVIMSEIRPIPIVEAPTSVAMDLPTLVRPNRQIVNDGRFLMASRGAANATQIANIKMEETLASSATPSRHDFHVPIFVSRPLGSFIVLVRLTPIVELSTSPITPLTVTKDCPGTSQPVRSVNKVLRVGFGYCTKHIAQIFVILWQYCTCISKDLFECLWFIH